jgi:hypothetical protein
MKSLYLPYIFSVCLVLTVIFETVLAFILGVRKGKDLFNVVLANVMTNPLVSILPLYFNLKYGALSRNISLVLLEIFALFAEYFIYKRFLSYKKIPPFLLSLILNAFSYTAGVILSPFIF